MHNDAPISQFIWQSQSFKVNDVAVLFCLIAVQEQSGLISPAARERRVIHLDGMGDEDWAESFNRLMKVGEVEWFEDEKMRGYLVTRFEQFEDALADFGQRRYFRERRRKMQENKERVCA